ncbi:MAG: response regulator [Myxococcaceae bacterium]|nr:response regulator [Myxococcaceae bacterium]
MLLVEDDDLDADLVRRELARDGGRAVVRRVDSAETMRSALTENEWDVVLSDWSLPRFSAVEALAIVQELGIDVPVIMLSGTIGEDVAVEAMRRGARDFIGKERLARLRPAIARELEERRARATHRRDSLALRVSEARFARLSESGLVGIVIADLHGTIHDANDMYLSMLGYTRDDLSTGLLAWDTLTPPEWAKADQAATATLQQQGYAGPWEKELLRKDGTRAAVLVGVALLDEANCIAVVQNISELKRAEKELQRSQETLRQVQKMEAIGSLAGGIAHDFNNLLTVILSYSMMVVKDLDAGDPLREYGMAITDAGNRAAALTRQLLAFSRKQILQPRRVGLDDAIGRMEKMLRRLIGEHIDFRLHMNAGRSTIKVDPSQLEQVLLNLVVNARDAMSSGGALTLETSTVSLDAAFVATRPGVTPGPHVKLSVADTGVGMDAETQARIFEPFFTTKGVGQGTGLGLSTVLGIVQQSQATIWVDSTPGKGTRFDLYFPSAGQEEDAEQAPIPESELKGTETVLLVEDDPSLRTVVMRVLRQHGYQVLEAQTAGDALVLSEQHEGKIHLLLTDVVMPRMGGRQLAERLVKQRPDMIVLYMSGYTDDDVVRHGVFEAKVSMLHKPITPDVLLRKVREVLRS